MGFHCGFPMAAFFFINIWLSTAASTAAALNAIDGCWRWNPKWNRDRQQLANCSVGFAGKMGNNVGKDLTHYVVTDQSDDPINPKPGTLRYGATTIKGRVWITFQRGTPMRIRLQKPLLVSSFTAIDGRGADVNIARGACLLLHKVTDIIIHGLRLHHCQPQRPGPVIAPDGKTVQLAADGDAIRLVESRKVWIDHNTLYQSHDGLIDVTRGSTGITISNNWFRNHDKVMLLGHDDAFVQDKGMKVTVVYNYFGPDCNQRMPRVRHGYAHVVNNLYQGWAKYAIGGSMNPSVKSQANYFIAPDSGSKQVTWGQGGKSWNFRSVDDVFENGAEFSKPPPKYKAVTVSPNYDPRQRFPVSNAKAVKSLTKSAGALKCPRANRCC